MTIGDADSFVEFAFKEAVPEHMQGATDTSCSVEATCSTFTGKVESVWFARDDINRFLSELEEFEATRKGSVSLLNMSSPSDYNPLNFEIVSIDRARHLVVKADLLEVRYLNGELSPLRVSVSFDLDTGMLRSILMDFRKLFAYKQERI